MPDPLTLLGDKALDVDPDLRFMALEDLRKHLVDGKADLKSRHIEKFIPILFRLLHDTNPNVQSQAVKTFAPVAHRVDERALLALLTRLYDEVEKEQGDRITTTIPSMAFHSILTGGWRLEPGVARRVVDAIVPSVFAKPVTIDSMELVIDIVHAAGFVLADAEIRALLQSVVDIVFTRDGMLGTRAAVALQELLGHVSPAAALEVGLLLAQLVDTHTGDTHKKLALFSIVLRRHASQHAVDIAVRTVHECLALQDPTDMDDFDLDAVARNNGLRALALSTLSDIVACVPKERLPVDYCRGAVVSFANYDPLRSPDSDSDAFSDVSDLEFDDDVDDNAVSDDGSWKVRFRACALAKCLMQNVPEDVPDMLAACLDSLLAALTDSSSAVAEEAVRTVAAAIDVCETTPANVEKIATTTLDLLHKPDSGLVHAVLELVISLARQKVLPRFWDQLFGLLGDLNTEIWRLYRAVLDTQLGQVSAQVVERIASDVLATLQASTNTHVLSENLTIAAQLLARLPEFPTIEPQLSQISDTVAAKCGDRQYSSELRQTFIATLCDYLATMPTTQDQQQRGVQVLEAALGYEATMRAVLTSCGSIFFHRDVIPGSPLHEFSGVLADRLTLLLASSDQTYNSLCLQILTKIVGVLEPQTTEKTVLAVMQYGLSTADPLEIGDCFSIMTAANAALGPEMVSVAAQLALKVDDESSVGFFQKLATSSSTDFFAVLREPLRDRPRLLAAMAVAQKNPVVDDVRKEVEHVPGNSGQTAAQEAEADLSIRFLGWAAFYGAHVPSATFFGRLESPSSTIKTAAASSLGLVLAGELRLNNSETLASLLQTYQSHPALRPYLLVAFRSIPTDQHEFFAEIWQKVWAAIWAGVAASDLEKQVGELRLAGDVLALACDCVPNLLDQQSPVDSDAEVYVHIAILKQLMAKVHDSLRLERRLEQVMPAIARMNIEIKQAMVGTFLTTVHRRTDVAERMMEPMLAAVYGELQARDEFKKTIPMGPYKYVVDEGLEIRKLCYELLYTAAGQQPQYRVSIASKVIEAGLVDVEPEVVLLACGVVRRCVAADSGDTRAHNGGGAAGGNSGDAGVGANPERLLACHLPVVALLIANVRTVFARKLRPKASAQEAETFELMIRNVVQMATDVNVAVHAPGVPPQVQHEWGRFFHEVETRM